MTTNTDDSTTALEPPPGSIADTYRLVMPLIGFEAVMTKGDDVALTVAPEFVHEVLERGRDDERLGMNLLRNLTAVDWVEQGLELVYHVYSIEHRHAATIKCRLPSEGATAPTVTDLFATADWAERECREMFGIEFLGHPDPRNLLLDEDLDIHPLRKSHPLAPIEIEQGVDVEYFTKQFPPEEPVSPQDKAADAAEAAAARPERKPDAELTEEEREAKRAEQAERVRQARELAAARRAERAAGAPPAGGPRPEGAAPPPTPAAPAAAVAPAAEAAPAAAPPREDRPPAPPPPELPTIPDAEEDPEGRAAAQAERVRIGRELAAARRAQLRGE